MIKRKKGDVKNLDVVLELPSSVRVIAVVNNSRAIAPITQLYNSVIIYKNFSIEF